MITAVLGPGGVGGFIAAALELAGEPVVVVASEPTAAHIAEHGISVRSVRLGDFSARPRVVSRLEEQVQTLVVATKASPGEKEHPLSAKLFIEDMLLDYSSLFA